VKKTIHLLRLDSEFCHTISALPGREAQQAQPVISTPNNFVSQNQRNTQKNND
jgi:hypothetical protein